MIAFYDRCIGGLAAVVGVCLVVVMLIVAAEAISRYFFASPLSWVFEVTEYLLLYIPFLGMAWLVRRTEGHVRIDVLVMALGPEKRALINCWGSMVPALTCLTAGYYAAWTTWDYHVRAILTDGVYPIPKYWLLVSIALGLILTGVEFARKGRRHFREWQLGGRITGDTP